MFKFDLKGAEDVIEDLESLFSPKALLKIKDKALIEGAEFMKKKIHDAQMSTKDTGKTAKELTYSKPRFVGDERVITFHWEGDLERYRVIHLVENGFYAKDGKFIKPDAYGQLEGIMAMHMDEYIRIVRDSIARQIGAA